MDVFWREPVMNGWILPEAEDHRLKSNRAYIGSIDGGSG